MAASSIRLTILSEDDVEKIHESSIELLEEVGVRFEHEIALELLRDSGADVDFSSQMVRFKPQLVKQLLAKAPAQFTWYGRDPNRRIQMGVNKVHFGSLYPIMTIIDLDGNRRPATYRDAEEAARLVDALENVDEGSAVFLPQDISPDLNLFYGLLAAFKNTTKPIRGRVYGKLHAQTSIEMAKVVAGGKKELRAKPLIIGHVNTVTPLIQAREQIEGLLLYGQYGLPVFISPEVQAGGTGPITLAGSLVLHNTEVLSAVCLAQAANPGAPVAYGQVSSILDMRTGSYCYGAVEHGMMDLATAQMADYYGLPSRGDAGYSDSKCLDMQAGFESALNLAMAAFGQHDFILGPVGGGLESVLAGSLEKLVIDNEVAGMVKRVLRGIEVTPATIALDLIKEIGPGGHYLGQKHTMAHLRNEQFLPTLANRQSYEAWNKAGREDIRVQANKKAREIIDTHQVDPLEPKMVRELEDVLQGVASEVQRGG